MTVQLTQEKMHCIAGLAKALSTSANPTIQQLAQFVGKLVATESGFTQAPLFYKEIEIYKNSMLAMHKGNYNANISLPDHILLLVTWWQPHVYDAIRYVHVPCPEHLIASDASDLGWGGIIDESYTTRGQWSSQEVESHINTRELQAAFFINRLASTKTQLMKLTKQMWCWALESNIILSAEYLPGCKNSTADAESRAVENTDAEWMIAKPIFEAICDHFGQPKIDLFASRLNKQLATCYAWRPDPEAAAIDAFMQPWQHDLMHGFPPFRIIGRVLQKTARDQATIILVAPMWPTQAWFSVALRMLIATPRVLPPDSLTLPQNPTLKHPLTKIAKSWREGTHKQYHSYLTKLVDFCNKRKANIVLATVKDFKNFYMMFIPLKT